MEVWDMEICQALRGLQQQLLIKHQEDSRLDPETHGWILDIDMNVINKTHI